MLACVNRREKKKGWLVGVFGGVCLFKCNKWCKGEMKEKKNL